MEIDELEGEALAEAICRARGIELAVNPRSFGDELPDHDTYYIYHNTFFNTRVVRFVGPEGDFNYQPHSDIAQAWELDGEGWQWEFRDDFSGLYLDAIISHPGHIVGRARIVYADFPTKAAAYATARCRAYLKAKAAE